MVSVGPPETDRKVKSLIYGPSGHGKTRLLGTANDDPRTSPMLLLDYEGGVSSLIGRDIDVVRITTWDEYEEVRLFLKGGKHGYKSVGIDSVSEAHVNALLGRLEDRQRKEANALDQNDYGVALVMMRRLLRSFRDLPLHVFCTALAKEETDVREGLIKKPALPGAMADEVLGIFESVSYLALAEDADKQIVRVLVMNPAPRIRAKTRVPLDVVPPDTIVDPTIAKILDSLKL